MFYCTLINPYIIYMTVILLFAFATYTIFTYRDYITKHKKIILIVLAILLTWSQIVRYGFVLIRDGFILSEYPPFFICRISSLVLWYYVITQDKRVESFLFYWGATGLAGVIYPNGPIDNIPNLTETFYIDHFLLGLTPFFLVAIQGFRPNKRNLLQVTGFMFIVLMVFIPLNNILDTDFFYTKNQSIFRVMFPNIPGELFGISFPDLSSVLFVITHTVVALGFFSIYYRYFKNYRIQN